MDKIRVRYSKTGKARYISHLDLMTAMQRSFIRAGISLRYSEGFNPHPYISVALPLPVGTESVCELMDVALAGSGIRDDINGFLPEGLQVLKAYRAFRAFNEIKWIEVECRLHYNEAPSQETVRILTERITAKSLIIAKKTKRGISDIDVAPHILDVGVSCGQGSFVELKARISAQNPTIGRKDITSIINNDDNIPKPNNIEMKRIENYDMNMVLFK